MNCRLKFWYIKEIGDTLTTSIIVGMSIDMGSGVNLTGYLDSSHMVSQYLLTHSKALKSIIREI